MCTCLDCGGRAAGDSGGDKTAVRDGNERRAISVRRCVSKSRLMYKSGMCVSTFDDVEGGSAVVRALPGSRFCTVEARSNKSRGRLGRAPGCECPGSHFCAPLGLVSMSGREEGGSLGEGELQGELANTREQRRWLSSGFQGNGCFLRSCKD